MRSGLAGAVAAGALAVALGGCASSGIVPVRGVVRAQDGRRAEPLGGASVQCRDARDAPPRYARVTTRDDGTYRVDCQYAGTWFPLVKPRSDAWLEFAAPGFEPRVVRLREGKEPGVARRTTGPYHHLDVTLVPAAAARGGKK
jgi:hypothetical protein